MWAAYLFQTATGRIGPRLEYSDLKWSVELNGVESLQLTLRKSELPAADIRIGDQRRSAGQFWLDPWWGGVVLLWNNKPIVAGPIISRPSESASTVSISCGGIRSVLANRIIVHEPLSNGLNDNKSGLSLAGVTLGTIAQRVVTAAQKKPGGALPISFPLPEESGIHERKYYGFDVQNNNADDILTKISNVLNGPDIMFKPRLIRDNQLTFDMWHGTGRDPRIAQKRVKTWDTTAEYGEVSAMTVNFTGTYMASRVFSIGAGTDEGQLITVSSYLNSGREGYPLLEKVVNVGSSDKPNIVRGHGEAHLLTNSRPLSEIQLTVRADSTIPLGEFWPGDVAQIITKGWLSIPDGMTKMRILSLTGDHTNSIKVSLQLDNRFE